MVAGAGQPTTGARAATARTGLMQIGAVAEGPA